MLPSEIQGRKIRKSPPKRPPAEADKGRRFGRTFLTVFAVFAALLFIGSLGNSRRERATRAAMRLVPDPVTYSNYLSIQEGATYQSVVNLFQGDPGSLFSQAGDMTTFVWHGPGLGSNVTVSFMKGLVTGKAQVGLR